MKKTIITSMTLFAVVLAYIALRSPAEKTKTANLAVAKTESEKVQTAKPKESAAAAFRKSRFASAEDWANVNAIAAQYAPELKALEAKRNRILEDPNATKSSIAPEARAARLKRDLANKAIRDKERELWAELSPHLSPYELREYKLKHSEEARHLREESAWFEPSKADFLALYTYREKLNDLLDTYHGGDTWIGYETLTSAADRRMDEQIAAFRSGKTDEEKAQAQSDVWHMEGDDMDYLRAFNRAQWTLRDMMGSDRVDKFFAGPNASIEKAYSDGLDQSYELWRSGQITYDEMEERQIRLDEEYNAALNSATSPAVPGGLE